AGSAARVSVRGLLALLLGSCRRRLLPGICARGPAAARGIPEPSGAVHRALPGAALGWRRVSPAPGAAAPSASGGVGVPPVPWLHAPHDPGRVRGRGTEQGGVL